MPASTSSQPAPRTTAEAPNPPVLRRGRGPSPQKTELTRSEILHAAIAEFMAVGIAKATMDKIAKRANLAKGTLYLHFGSKEDLLLGALEITFTQSAMPSFHTPRQASESVHDYLQRLTIPPMQRFHESVRPDLARLMLGEAKSFPALAQFYREKIFDPWHRHFEHLFQTAIDEGELQGISPVSAARLLGSPFWIYLASDSLQADDGPGCTAAELTAVQIEAIFGRYGTAAAHRAVSSTQAPQHEPQTERKKTARLARGG